MGLCGEHESWGNGESCVNTVGLEESGEHCEEE